MVEFSETEQRILRVLADGMAHPVSEIMAVVDEFCTRNNLSVHMWRIRKKLKSKGQSVICEVGQGQRTFYRHVILLAPSVE